MATNTREKKPATQPKAVAAGAEAAAPAKVVKATKAVKAPKVDTAKNPAEPKLKAKAKSAAPSKPADAHKDKPKKPKLVRDSFTMPEAEYQALGEVKKACLKAGVEVKKSELLRVGVALVRAMDVDKLTAALKNLTPLKAGRPRKEK